MPAQYPVPDVDLGRLLDDAVQDFPDLDALAHRGRRLTYRELLDRVDRLAGVLLDLGITSGDRVVVALPSSPGATITLFAVWRLGAVAVLLDPSAPAHPDAVIAEAAHGARVVVRHDRLPVPGDLDRGVDHVLVTGPEDDLPFPRNLLATARRRGGSLRAPRLVRSSGRRGAGVARLADLVHRRAPLIVADQQSGPALRIVEDGRVASYDHAALVAAAFLLRLWLPDALAGTERIGSAMPLHDAVGVTAGVTTPVLVAATAVLPRRVGRRALARAVDAADPTILIVPGEAGARPVGVGWLDELRKPGGSLRIVLQRGPVSTADADAVSTRTGARLRGFWAPAGAAGPVSGEPVYGRPHSGSVGIPLTAAAVGVSRGRLIVSGPHLARGWARDGWMATDRPGSVDDDGYVLLAPAQGSSGSPTASDSRRPPVR